MIRSPRQGLATLVVVTSLTLAACGGSDDATNETPPADTAVTTDPVTTDAAVGNTVSTPVEETDEAVDDGKGATTRVVEHAYGTTEIPAEPERVVALSEEFLLADLLALDIVPVASTANDAAAFAGIDPVATNDVENLGFADVNLEQVAALRPDVLVAYPGYIEIIGYDTLNAVAPTIAIGDDDSDWRERLQLTAAAFGVDGIATERIAGIEDELADAREVVDGLDVSVLSISPGPFLRAYTDDRTTLTEVMTQLGVTFSPSADEADGTDDNGRTEVSLERLGELDGEVLVLLQTSVIDDEDAAVRDVENSPLWETLPAVQNDAVVTLDRLAYPGASGVGAFASDLAAAIATT